MNKEIISFQINENLLEKLTFASKELEVSRSDIIRMALKEYLSNLDKAIHQEYGKFL